MFSARRMDRRGPIKRKAHEGFLRVKKEDSYSQHLEKFSSSDDQPFESFSICHAFWERTDGMAEEQVIEEKVVWDELVKDDYAVEAADLLSEEGNMLLNHITPSVFNTKIREMIDQNRELSPLFGLIPDESSDIKLSPMDKFNIEHAMRRREQSSEEKEMWIKLFEKGLGSLAAREINLSRREQLHPDELLKIIMWHYSRGGIRTNNLGTLEITHSSRKRLEVEINPEKFQSFETDAQYTDLEGVSNDASLSLIAIMKSYFAARDKIKAGMEITDGSDDEDLRIEDDDLIESSPLHKLFFVVENNMEKDEEVIVSAKIGIDLSGITAVPKALRRKIPSFPASFIIKNDESFSTGISVELKLSKLAKNIINKIVDMFGGDNDTDVFLVLKEFASNFPDELSGGLASFKLGESGLSILGHTTKDFFGEVADDESLTELRERGESTLPLSVVKEIIKKISEFINIQTKINNVEDGLSLDVLSLLTDKESTIVAVVMANDEQSEFGVDMDFVMKEGLIAKLASSSIKGREPSKGEITDHSLESGLIKDRVSGLLKKWGPWIISTISPIIFGSGKISKLNILDNGDVSIKTQ